MAYAVCGVFCMIQKMGISILDIPVSDYECYLFKISTAQIMRQYR